MIPMNSYRIWVVAALCVALEEVRTMSTLHSAGHYLFLALLLAFSLRLIYVTIAEHGS